MKAATLADNNQMQNEHIDQIIALLPRVGKIDLAEHDLAIRVLFCNMAHADDISNIEDFAQEFFLDRVEYINERMFVLHITGMTQYTDETLETALIDRQPDIKRQFVVSKDNDMNSPYISDYFLCLILNLLNSSGKGLGK